MSVFRSLGSLIGCWGLVLALSVCAPARAAEALEWSALQPPATIEHNPFSALRPEQLDRLSELALSRMMEARGRPVTAEMLARRAELSEALKADGLDADALLRARDVLIEQRRAAAVRGVAQLDGRVVRISGYLVPASANGREVTDLLFVPWAGACSHTPPPPANQIIRLPAAALPGIDASPFELVQLVGTLRVRAQESVLMLVDGQVELRSAYTAEAVRLEAIAPRVSANP